MSNTIFAKGAAATAIACALMIAPTAHAIDKCKVKVGKTGVIAVDAFGVSGALTWGTAAGSEDATFFNAGTCVAGAKAKGCQLADPATLDAKTPPAGCTLYLADAAAPCSVWIRGCTPGARAQAGANADFFAVMPPDNAATVAVGAAVQFPQGGPGTGPILRTGPATFSLHEIGTYEVQFVVAVSEPGQLVVALNSGAGFLEVPSTVVGRATGTSQITGFTLVTTSVVNTLLEIRNSTGSPAAMTITPLSGGSSPASAHLVIKKL